MSADALTPVLAGAFGVGVVLLLFIAGRSRRHEVGDGSGAPAAVDAGSTGCGAGSDGGCEGGGGD